MYFCEALSGGYWFILKMLLNVISEKFIEYYDGDEEVDDLEVEVAEQTLVVRSKDKKEDTGELLHQGISYRKFRRSWTLADDVIVTDAKMENGMLLIQLEHVVPEEKKPRLVEIK